MGFDLRQYASRTVVRVVITVLVMAALSYVGIGKAEAAGACGPNGEYDCTTMQEIDSACSAWVGQAPAGYERKCEMESGYNNRIRGKQRAIGPPPGAWSDGSMWIAWGGGCTAPLSWDFTSHSCKDAGAACLAKNADLPQTNAVPFTGTQCVGGCSYGFIGSGGAVDGMSYGSMGYTGQTCSTAPPPPPFDPKTKKDQTCSPAGGGMTFCVKANGDHCASASTGRQVCWKPGETGTKTDGNVIQKRVAGPNPPTAPPAPEGETLTPGTGPKTTTTTPTGGGSPITTTTRNYNTTYGTNGGPTNSGEPSTGGTPAPAEEKGSASGGEGCDVPPTCGGDPVGCATLQQVWRNRCSEGKNKITGGGECDANGNPVFVCSGDQVLCKTAETQARAYCLAKKGDGNGNGQPDWSEGDGPGAPGNDGEDGDIGVGTVGVSTDMLDTENIFGGGSCPVFSVTIYGQTMTSASIPEWCDIVAIMRAVVLLMGAFAAVRILMGE